MAVSMKAMLKLNASSQRVPSAGPCCGGHRAAHKSGCTGSCCRRQRVATKAVASNNTGTLPKEVQKQVANATSHLEKRMDQIVKHFPSATSVDDFLMRAEVSLCAHGMRGDNCIACTNLCRDESTGIFKAKIDEIFGASFNINGLGACLTCGCLGFKAGFSHSPNLDGRERYIFFSMPHVAIDSKGTLGAIARPGRAGPSTACGALIAALGQFQADPAMMTKYAEGEHDPVDPEFSILKQRLAARIFAENADVKTMNLVDMTALAERAITADLEVLIKETVDPATADYAVMTGVHIHSWGAAGTDDPLLEWIAPRLSYAVVNGRKIQINLDAVPAMTPRQMALLQNIGGPAPTVIAGYAGSTTVVESALS